MNASGLVRIGVADERHLDAAIELLEEAASWLRARGIHQWEPGSMVAQRPVLAGWARSGGLAIARSDVGPAGACFLVDEPTEEWTAHPGRALYLHKLVVARSHAGRGVGGALLGWCTERAREWRTPRIRLDCWDGNDRLRAFYRAAGYRELEAVPSHGYRVRLFELDLAAG